MELLGGDDAELVLAAEVEVVLGIDLPAQSHLERAARQQQALFHCAAHGCSVRMGTAEVASPCVVVRVELNERNLSELLVNRPQNGQEDGMVSADAQRASFGTENLIQLSCNPAESVVQRKRVDREVAVVGDPPFGKR